MNITIADVRTAAIAKGATCLSGRIVSLYTLLEFTCRTCQQPFKQRWLQFKKGNGNCPSCNRLRGAANPASKQLSDAERAARDPAVRLKAHKAWELAVFKRDGHKCQLTGKKATLRDPLVAHHLADWASHPELRDDPANGVTIKRSLHRLFHSRYGYQCTPEQFAQFKQELAGA